MTNPMQDFESNLATAVKNEGGHGAFNPDNTGLDAVRVATGNIIAWRPPTGSEPQHSEITTAARAIRIASAAAQQAKAIEDDAMRSDLAKQRDAANCWLDADRQLTAIEAEAARDAVQFDEALHEAFAPPALDISDFVGASNDCEVRNWVRTLSTDELGNLVQEFQAGQHSRTLTALVRSPTPLPAGLLAHSIPAIWAGLVRKTNPRAAVIESRSGRQEWVRMVLSQTRAALPHARGATVARAA